MLKEGIGKLISKLVKFILLSYEHYDDMPSYDRHNRDYCPWCIGFAFVWRQKIPGLMKSMGQGIRQFKEGMREAPQSFKEGMEDEPQKEPYFDGSENQTEISENPRINEDKQ